MSERKFLVKRIRIGLVGLVVLTLAGVTAGGALADSTGRGTAAASVTLLDVNLGNIQHLKVVSDEVQGTLDAARLGVAGPQAYGQFKAVDATGAINLMFPSPVQRADAPGTSNASIQSYDVAFPGSAVPIPATGLPVGIGNLVTGTVNLSKLEANQDAAGARSVVGTNVPTLSVLQGLISANGINIAGVSSNASPSSSKADSGEISIDNVNVLDLDSFLGALGLSLDDLGIGTITSMIDKLGLPIPTGALGLGNLTGSGVSGILSSVFNLASLTDQVTNAADCSALGALPVSSLLAPVDSILGTSGLLGSLSLPLLGGSVGSLISGCTVGNLSSTKTGILDNLHSTLDGMATTADGVLDQVFSTLAGAPLIQISGLKLGALANAADTLAGTTASTTADLGTIKVGGISLGAIDLNSTVAQINDLKGTVLGTLNGVLSPLGLGNLIDIGILERTSSTKNEGSYNVADAGLSVLRVSINPPAALSSVLSTAGALTNPLSGIMSQVGNTLAANPLSTGALASAFGLTSLLSQPTTITVGGIHSQADFTSVLGATATNGGPVAPPVSGTLPRTGGTNGALLAALAALAMAGAFGITRTLRKAPVEG
jgi:hypothetical protein